MLGMSASAAKTQLLHQPALVIATVRVVGTEILYTPTHSIALDLPQLNTTTTTTTHMRHVKLLRLLSIKYSVSAWCASCTMRRQWQTMGRSGGGQFGPA